LDIEKDSDDAIAESSPSDPSPQPTSVAMFLQQYTSNPGDQPVLDEMIDPLPIESWPPSESLPVTMKKDQLIHIAELVPNFDSDSITICATDGGPTIIKPSISVAKADESPVIVLNLKGHVLEPHDIERGTVEDLLNEREAADGILITEKVHTFGTASPLICVNSGNQFQEAVANLVREWKSAEDRAFSFA